VSVSERRFKRANKKPPPFPVVKKILSISHDKKKVPSPSGFNMTSMTILIVKYEHNVDQTKVTPFPFRWHIDPLCGRFYGSPLQGLGWGDKTPQNTAVYDYVHEFHKLLGRLPVTTPVFPSHHLRNWTPVCVGGRQT
jgi:hypothetical protein